MACDAQELVNNARCFQCFGSGALFDAMEVVLLCAILDGDQSMACDPQTLISQANCLLCTVPNGMWEAIKVYLLCQIASGAGGSGGGVTCGVANPVAAPTGNCGLFYRTDTGTLWMWNGAAWVELIA